MLGILLNKVLKLKRDRLCLSLFNVYFFIKKVYNKNKKGGIEMIKVTIELTNDEIKRENEIKNAISDILDCYEIEYKIQTIKKED